jgi:3-oxoacyl-[acyl-carrier-protein] synthase-3
MGTIRVDNVRMVGLASAVPETVITAADDAKTFGEDETRRVVKNTGVAQRRVVKDLCVSDLCVAAGERLLGDLGWSRDSVDVVVMVTQCPDYPSPATAGLVQDRMGLRTSCAAFDVNLGCSGYTYGLWILSAFLATGAMKRGLLMAGDTVTRAASPHDRSVVPLFGDAGSTTALEYQPGAPPIDFVLGTDGSGAKHLHTRSGGHRHWASPASFEMKVREDGVIRSDLQTYMNGAEVLTFAMKSVPKFLTTLKEGAGWSEEDVKAYVFHQASLFMLKNVARCARIPMTKVVLGLENYGNTSSASIPLAMSDQLRRLETSSERLILAGFGIGWSWAAAAMTVGPMVMPPVIIVPDVKVDPPF